MPNLKTNVKGVDRTVVDQFAPYDGPEPTPGYYTAVPQSPSKMTKTANGNYMITTIFKLKANPKDNPTKKQFDGYSSWDRTVIAENEFSKARLANWLDAMVGDDGADLTFDAIDDGGKITKIGRKKIETLVGKQEVRVLLKYGSGEYANRLECDGVLPWEPATGVSGTTRQNAAATSQPVRQEAEVVGEVDAGDEDEAPGEDEEPWDRSERLEELNEANLPDIKKLAKDYELDVKGPRAKIITAILDYEEENFSEEADEEQEEEDAETALRDELATLTLPKLRGRAAKAGAETNGPKKKLIDAIVVAELGQDEDGDDEETALTAESPLEDLIAAIAGIDGYSASDFEGYEDNDENRAELVEIAEEEGLFTADEETEPF